MLRRPRPEKDSTQTGTVHPPTLAGDRTVFRVGSLGGEPPAFLTPAIASEIAEMFGYREGDADPAILDIRSTMVAHMRGGDQATLNFERRRELPTVLILTDRSSATRAWHTLATEFESALAARGVSLEAIRFSGSLHEIRTGVPRPEALALESAVAAPGWTVTTVFAEAHRLSGTDIGLLKRVSENGPVLFFDIRETSLWDTRHAQLMDAGISVLPATALHLRDGLARIFAPDRSADKFRVTITAKALPPSADTETISKLILGDALEWAQECALVQPISFALAERLRKRHLKLTGPEGQIAFSRLEALPGTWVSPEGLRFEPRLRRHLLGSFGARDDANQAGAVGIIEAAFADEPAGETESALWRYALAQVHLFAKATMDEAWLEIEDVKHDGLVDVPAMEDFIRRLRAPNRPINADTVALPAEPTRAAFRKQVLGTEAGYEYGDLRVHPAQWDVGFPEVRVTYAQRDASQRQDPSGNSIFDGILTRSVVGPNHAAFLSNGHHVVVDSDFDSSAGISVTLLDSATLERQPLEWPGSDGEIAGIWTARDANVAAFLVPGRPAIVLRPKGAASESTPLMRENLELATVGDAPLGGPETLMAVSPQGDWLVAQQNDTTLLLIDTSTGRLRDQISTKTRVSALTFPQSQFVIAALVDGTLLSIDIGEGKMRVGDPLVQVGGEPVAIAVLQPDQRNGPMVIAFEDGSIMLFEPGRSTIEQRPAIRLRWPARRIIPFADRPAVQVTLQKRSPDDFTGSSARASPSETGISVAVLGRKGEFDIIGLPFQNAESDAVIEATRGSFQGGAGSFSPLSLLNRDFRPARDGIRVIAVAALSRRIAVVRAGAFEVRPLIYQRAKAPRAAKEGISEPAKTAEGVPA
jgi:hypothetical protein